MKHKLLKLICASMRKECDDICGYTGAGFCLQCEQIADHLLANGVTFAKDTDGRGKWIHVTERLPETNESVLILENHSVETSFYNEDLDGWGYGHDNPSHWMPLPGLPEEG